MRRRRAASPHLARVARLSCLAGAALLMPGCPGPEPEPSTEPILPIEAPIRQEPIACLDRYPLPEALTGSDGLGHFGWSPTQLEGFTARWGVPDTHTARWISDNANTGPSARVHVLRAPDVGQCIQDELRAAVDADQPLAATLQASTPWTHDQTDLSELVVDQVTVPTYDFAGGNALYRALYGARLDRQGDDPEAPGGFGQQSTLDAANAWPQEAAEPLARLVLALGTARRLRDRAFADADPAAMQRIEDLLQQEGYTSQWLANLHPRAGTMLDDLDTVAPQVDRAALNASALVLAQAVDEVQAVLASVEPFEGGDVDVFTPWGRVVLRSSDTSDTQVPTDLALLVDLGGNDTYATPVASAHSTVPVSVLVDVRGDDTYDPGQPDLQAPDMTAARAFDRSNGFTQGSAVLGVALLSDGAGDDAYRASVYSQASAILGVGVLDDRGGSDTYMLGGQGQGTALFGLAVLRDAAGDDDYRGFTNIQGVGKPGGVGLLLDQDGTDLYAALHQEQEPWLPAETSANNLLGLPASHPYGVDGTPHFMSIAQGTGWGYRHEWVNALTGTSQVWGGGLGALVDLGAGDDTHVADCFALGQGFVYGLGFFYDGGGDDTYATFWWGPGASAHMGVGLFWEEDGHDSLYTTRASAGFGYDLGVGWMIDEGGDDDYGGQLHYGRGYLNAHTIFVNDGGDDHYNLGGVRNNPYFGVVRGGSGNSTGLRLLGAFLDLGGGQDTYETGVEGPDNDAVWHHAPVGDNVDPDNHIGIGIDR